MSMGSTIPAMQMEYDLPFSSSTWTPPGVMVSHGGQRICAIKVDATLCNVVVASSRLSIHLLPSAQLHTVPGLVMGTRNVLPPPGFCVKSRLEMCATLRKLRECVGVFDGCARERRAVEVFVAEHVAPVHAHSPKDTLLI